MKCKKIYINAVDSNISLKYNRCEFINWIKNHDGSYEAEYHVNGDSKVICKCGRYMKTHVYYNCDKYKYITVAKCACDDPEPDIVIIYNNNVNITMTKRELEERDCYNWEQGFNKKVRDENICRHLRTIEELL